MENKLEKQIKDWKKLKNAQEKIRDATPEVRQMYIQNFYFGVRAYYIKYNEKFDHENPPTEPHKNL